ncbi:unnamed protein product [Colias eurytheme]|nr:unnamed protein product [Colias eurytheme]
MDFAPISIHHGTYNALESRTNTGRVRRLPRYLLVRIALTSKQGHAKHCSHFPPVESAHIRDRSEQVWEKAPKK